MSLQANPGINPANQGKGCFFYGCLTAIIISIVLIFGIYFGFRYVLSSVMDEYTQTNSVSLPPLDSSTESYLRVKGRVEEFQQAARQNQVSNLELSASELNTYLSSHPGLEGVSDHFRVIIEGSDLKGVASLGLEPLGYPDRFFNGTVFLTLKMVEGNLDVRLAGLQVGSKTLPDTVVSQLAAENLVEQLKPEGREKVKEILSGVSVISVENGLVKLKSGAQK
jgi:hypothetical protein